MELSAGLKLQITNSIESNYTFPFLVEKQPDFFLPDMHTMFIAYKHLSIERERMRE